MPIRTYFFAGCSPLSDDIFECIKNNINISENWPEPFHPPGALWPALLIGGFASVVFSHYAYRAYSNYVRHLPREAHAMAVAAVVPAAGRNLHEDEKAQVPEPRYHRLSR
jgi:hypothetical protein